MKTKEIIIKNYNFQDYPTLEKLERLKAFNNFLIRI